MTQKGHTELGDHLVAAGIFRRIRAGETLDAKTLLEARAYVECPHCNTVQQIVSAVNDPVDGVNPWTGTPDQYFRIQLADGAWARLWKTEPPGMSANEGRSRG